MAFSLRVILVSFFVGCVCVIPIKGRMELLQLQPAWDSLFLAMRGVGKRKSL
jgi:hypothetical protein